MATEDDPSTIAAPSRHGDHDSGDSRPLVPALTIQWHPDLSRVGQSASLGVDVIQVSRRKPPFDSLADVVLSRTPFLVVDTRSDHVEIRPGTTSLRIEVDGAPLVEPRQISLKHLEGGAIVTLADTIVVCMHLVRQPTLRGPDFGMVGGGDSIERVRRQIANVADLTVPVLIRGETGTGKEKVARALAAASGRASGPFIAINMATVPPTTAADVLFGHEKGAFTGASDSRPGLFLQADGGTLFLDEVGVTPLDVQTMLLRVLDEGEVRPLGSLRPRKVSVRVVAATDANLEDAIQEGTFAEPLLHRLAGYQIRVPALRERREDIGPLFLHFLRKAMEATDELGRLAPRRVKDRPWLAARDFARIAHSALPGNVRGLSNIAQQLAISSRGHSVARIDQDVERLLTAAGAESPVAEQVSAKPVYPVKVTDDAIQDALRKHNYNFAAAAAALGINRSTLYDRTRDSSIDVRSASSLTDEEVLGSHVRHQGDVAAMANELRVSPKPLKARVTETLRRRRP